MLILLMQLVLILMMALCFAAAATVDDKDPSGCNGKDVKNAANDATKVPPKSVLSFLELRKRCPKNQIPQLDKLQAKHRSYVERLMALKEGRPTIDWDYYKRNVRTESVKMVEQFENKYMSMTIPYPKDVYTKEIEKLKEHVKKEIVEFKKESNKRIEAYEKEIERVKSLIPYDQMTWEDYCEIYPEEAPDFLNKPTFWPHTEDEQLGYVEPEEVLDPKKAKKKL